MDGNSGRAKAVVLHVGQSGGRINDPDPRPPTRKRLVHTATFLSAVQDVRERRRKRQLDRPRLLARQSKLSPYHSITRALLLQPAECHALVGRTVPPEILTGDGQLLEPLGDRREEVAWHVAVRSE